MAPTVHLVYPHQRVNRTPDVIGWRVADDLGRDHEVEVHDWDARYAIRPHSGDVLVGHPHPLPGTVLRRSWNHKLWSRRIVLAPYSGDVFQVAFEDPFIRTADAYCAITGRTWSEAVSFGPLAHWASLMTQLDLAVDRDAFPNLKPGFNPPGRRRALYIGHTAAVKNPEFLEAIAASAPEIEFGWVGKSARPLRGFVSHGRLDLDTPSARSVVASYDVLVAVGRADANPTTVLEAMAWGLIPVVTPTSGYADEPGMRTVPLDDIAAAVSVLRELNAAGEEVLLSLQAHNRERLDSHYTWDRFHGQLRDALRASPASRPLLSPSWRTTLLLRGAALASPHLLTRSTARSVLRGGRRPVG